MHLLRVGPKLHDDFRLGTNDPLVKIPPRRDFAGAGRFVRKPCPLRIKLSLRQRLLRATEACRTEFGVPWGLGGDVLDGVQGCPVAGKHRRGEKLL